MRLLDRKEGWERGLCVSAYCHCVLLHCFLVSVCFLPCIATRSIHYQSCIEESKEKEVECVSERVRSRYPSPSTDRPGQIQIRVIISERDDQSHLGPSSPSDTYTLRPNSNFALPCLLTHKMPSHIFSFPLIILPAPFLLTHTHTHTPSLQAHPSLKLTRRQLQIRLSTNRCNLLRVRQMRIKNLLR